MSFAKPAHPSAAASLEAEREAAIKAVNASQKSGPADIRLRDQGQLHLPQGYIWVPVPAAAQLMRAMGNTVGSNFMGLVFPENGADWLVVLSFVNEGYIKDDDAKDWKADELLQNLKDGTEAANDERVKHGIAPVEVIGWVQSPQYDAAMHRLVWAASIRDKGARDTEGQGVNYNTYALGRDGYISLNLVTNASDLEKYKPDALTLLAALQYEDGKRYTDFNASTDKVAAYGLAALVAGAAAKKLGLFATLLALLAKFGKVLILAGAGALWGIGKFFTRKT
ncbi:MAG: DUF2167 domain-containing protein [Betaproteobacteria bacterium]|nr:DUF2167 domain-containing protein [Betaproteobacteria bacterium]MCL2885372.1 DUF2167 domain-containing protein [Betaproteobacteria bacterium]